MKHDMRLNKRIKRSFSSCIRVASVSRKKFVASKQYISQVNVCYERHDVQVSLRIATQRFNGKRCSLFPAISTMI